MIVVGPNQKVGRSGSHFNFTKYVFIGPIRMKSYSFLLTNLPHPLKTIQLCRLFSDCKAMTHDARWRSTINGNGQRCLEDLLHVYTTTPLASSCWTYLVPTLYSSQIVHKRVPELNPDLNNPPMSWVTQAVLLKRLFNSLKKTLMQVLNCFYRCAAAAQEFVWHDATVLFRFARPADESLAALIWCLSSSDPPYTHLLKNIHVIAHCTHDSVPLAGLPATTAWPHGCKKSVCVSPFVRGRSLQKTGGEPRLARAHG
jgi:hypothetical protein